MGLNLQIYQKTSYVETFTFHAKVVSYLLLSPCCVHTVQLRGLTA